jgi:hypothetical protein
VWATPFSGRFGGANLLPGNGRRLLRRIAHPLPSTLALATYGRGATGVWGGAGT